MKLKTLASITSLTAAVILPTAAQSADDVTLILDWTPGGFAAAWYYGVENGCFPDRDINLTVERGYGGGDTVTKIAAGTGDFGVADLSSIMLGKLTADAGVTAIMPQYTSSPLAVGVLTGSGISSLQDLAGKTIAAAPGDSAIRILPVAFEEVGANFSTIEVETVDAATLSGLLIQEQVDAITTYSTTALIINQAAQNVGKSVESINFGSDLGIYSNSVMTSDTLIDENLDLVERFKSAAICAFEATREDIPAAVAAMNTSLGGMDEALHTSTAEASLPLVFEGENYEATGFEWNPEGVEKTFDIAIRAQGVESEADPMSFVLAD